MNINIYRRVRNSLRRCSLNEVVVGRGVHGKE